MPKLILVDHSLKRVGGHHYDYASNVLRAAEAAGLEVALGAHRRFRRPRGLPAHWPCFPVFRHDTYSPYAMYAGSRSRAECERRETAAPDSSGDAGGAGLHGLWRRWDRRRRIRRFAAACAALFRRAPLADGDHVFFPTLSEFDLLGLAEYLGAEPQSRRAHWHLQFHFNIFEGRPPEYERQSRRLECVRACFETALRRAASHRIYWYSTSPQVAAQYNRLELGRFENLAYPIGPEFVPRPWTGEPARPLRLACAGAIRREKGQRLLGELAAELWNEGLADGRLQLHVQTNKWWFRVPEPGPAQADRPVAYWRHPLSPERYVAFIRSADIGLMLYDSRRYYVRRAGVLGELLASGVPVVVPAGCWLSEQLAEAGFAHAERTARQGAVLRQGELRAAAGAVRAAGGAWDASGRLHVPPRGAVWMQLEDPPPQAVCLALRFRWCWPLEEGTYVRIALRGAGAPGSAATEFADQADWQWIVGRRSGGAPAVVLLPVPSGARRIQLEWANAFDDGPIRLADVAYAFLGGLGDGAAPPPLGAVGLAAAAPARSAALVREIAAHYDHYRRSAIAFSESWRRAHDPARTVAQLLERAAC